MAHPIERLGPEAAGEVAEVVAAGATAEVDALLDEDDLGDLLWDGEPGIPGGSSVVLAVRGAGGALAGVIAATVRPGRGHDGATTRTGHVRLLVVHPDHRRLGIAGALVDAAEAWLAERNVDRVVLGGEAPVYVWPGLPADDEVLVDWARRRSYEGAATSSNMELDATYRAAPPEGVTVSRVVEDGLVDATKAFVAATWPEWSEEVRRAVERGTLLAAVESGEVVGFCAHSALRAGWVGPIATSPAVRRRGIAAALLGAACLDLTVVGRPVAEIGWVGPVDFYERLGARPGRRWIHVARDLR